MIAPMVKAIRPAIDGVGANTQIKGMSARTSRGTKGFDVRAHRAPGAQSWVSAAGGL